MTQQNLRGSAGASQPAGGSPEGGCGVPPPRPEQWLAAQRDEDRARMAKDCELSGMYQNPESHQQDIQLGMTISTSNMV